MSTKVLLVSMFSNIFLTLIKIIIGFLGNSKALIADGVHSFSDLSTDVIAILGDKLSNKPADDDHPYGHGKINYLTSVLIGIAIMLMGLALFRNSFASSIVIPSKINIVVVVITIIVKYLVSGLLISVGKKQNNNILISSGKESFSDVFSSILVLVSLIASQFYKYVPIFKYTDIVASIVISIIIFIVGVRILIENFNSLIGQIELSFIKKNEVLKFLIDRNYDVVVDDILLLKYGTYYRAVVKVLVPNNINVKKLIQINKTIENDLLNSSFHIKYVNIDIDLLEGREVDAGITRGRNSKRSFKKKIIK